MRKKGKILVKALFYVLNIWADSSCPPQTVLLSYSYGLSKDFAKMNL